VVHRELNIGDATSEEIVFRIGSGQVTFNVDGPDPARAG
jgi:hypothetical protein